MTHYITNYSQYNILTINLININERNFLLNMVVEQCAIVLWGENKYTALGKTMSELCIICIMGSWLADNTDQIIVAVVTNKWPTAVARAVSSSRIGAGIAHQVSISLGEESGGEDACQWQSGRLLNIFRKRLYHILVELTNISLLYWQDISKASYVVRRQFHKGASIRPLGGPIGFLSQNQQPPPPTHTNLYFTLLLSIMHISALKCSHYCY